jgi:hypothetical protein
VKFFFDNNLPARLAKALNALAEPDHSVVHLKDRFSANTADEVWLSQLGGEEDWVIISGDQRILKNPHEIKAWKAAKHTTFFLKKAWMALGFWDQAQKMVKCFPELIRQAESAHRGSQFQIGVNGKIE